MTNLKPCPFCGGEAGVVANRPFPDAYVQCGECDAEGPVSASEAAAVNAWNRRVVDPALAAAEARAEKAEAALREAKASTLREVAEDFERRATTSDICADKALDPRFISGTSHGRHEMHRSDAARFRDEAKRLRDAAAALAPTTTEGGAE
jgi:Lar family restriction alleviation protein